MAFSIAKAANWLHQVHRARAVVGWWPEQFALEDERTAYKVQDALLKKLVPRQGPLVGYKIALTSPQIWEQTGLAEDEDFQRLMQSDALPPITILVPAYNESATIETSVTSQRRFDHALKPATARGRCARNMACLLD